MESSLDTAIKNIIEGFKISKKDLDVDWDVLEKAERKLRNEK